MVKAKVEIKLVEGWVAEDVIFVNDGNFSVKPKEAALSANINIKEQTDWKFIWINEREK